MKSNVYAPSNLEPEEAQINNRNIVFGKVCAFISVFMLSTFVGLIVSIEHVYEIFQEIKLTGTGDPKVMAGAIAQALVPTVTSLFISLPAMLLAVISVYFSSYRSNFIYKIWQFTTVALLISFPFGTVCGLAFGLFVFFKRTQFGEVT